MKKKIKLVCKHCGREESEHAFTVNDFEGSRYWCVGISDWNEYKEETNLEYLARINKTDQ